MQDKKHLFIDLDGTCAEWHYVPQYKLYEKGYFLNLKPQQAVIDAIKQLYHDLDICILSCYLIDSKFAYQEKNEWVERYLPKSVKRIFLPCGLSKAEAVQNYTGQPITRTDILLDDFSHHLHQWKAAGGTGLKLLNGINGTKGSWHGLKISAHNCRRDLQTIIQSI